ncbi:hypothetical protein PTTG_26814 [Puccinia triticina 1-1 BBBD Race 1]|uniref:Uncharacterized protein n=1 Tax=Puccinia triticina (isolate 1-1 / race 1 (BBBD)) TaxID=630390 RepID=A0A180GQV4_PUCT1|nr:hypothetical protein PTTG_26814 [Puccinia triticina 1-1 BBBD Race 1]WAR62013.1 hypothetical protein PtB15_14B107 [Puccinia triticina]
MSAIAPSQGGLGPMARPAPIVRRPLPLLCVFVGGCLLVSSLFRKQNIDLVLSPANPAWMTELVDEAYQTIVLANQTVTTWFEDEQGKRSLHPLMVEFLREKRRRLLGSYSPSHLISWMKHPPPAQESELAVVAMRAAPFDQAGTLVQLAVRFRSRQSLKIRDKRGLVVFGSHSEPQPIMEVSPLCCFPLLSLFLSLSPALGFLR